MVLENRLEIRLTQKLILTPQLQQAMKLLQLPQLELLQALSQEMMENPFLEESLEEVNTEELTREEKESFEIEEINEDTEVPLERLMNFIVDDYFEERGSDGRDLGYFNPGTVTPPSFEQFLTKKQDLYDYLLWQLGLSTESEEIRKIGENIIGNLDENGYLLVSLEELAEQMNTDISKIEQALRLVQSFDPPGVCARDLKECLLLQLEPLNLKGTLVEKIIINNIKELEKKKYKKIAHYYKIPLSEVMAAIRIIEKLEPKPGRNFASTKTNYIVPDVFVTKTPDGYQIILNDDGIPKLRISNLYRKLIRQKDEFLKEEKQFMMEKLRSAIALLKSLEQRDRTIYRVTEAIVELQRDFFDKGREYINPLTLKDVASKLNMHESTISRVTSNKYLSCQHGIFSFRYFFSNALNTGTGRISSTTVKNTIKKIIEEEDPENPLSDQKIVDILKNKGIIVARRTVAKYREELKILPQAQRRKIN
jgi:RNA polymerase sigma-54 factor